MNESYSTRLNDAQHTNKHLNLLFWSSTLIVLTLIALLLLGAIPNDAFQGLETTMAEVGDPHGWANSSVKYRAIMPTVYHLTMVAMTFAFVIGFLRPEEHPEMRKIYELNVAKRIAGLILTAWGISLILFSIGSDIPLTTGSIHAHTTDAIMFNNFFGILSFEYMYIRLAEYGGESLKSIIRTRKRTTEHAKVEETS